MKKPRQTKTKKRNKSKTKNASKSNSTLTNMFNTQSNESNSVTNTNSTNDLTPTTSMNASLAPYSVNNVQGGLDGFLNFNQVDNNIPVCAIPSNDNSYESDCISEEEEESPLSRDTNGLLCERNFIQTQQFLLKYTKQIIHQNDPNAFHAIELVLKNYTSLTDAIKQNLIYVFGVNVIDTLANDELRNEIYVNHFIPILLNTINELSTIQNFIVCE